MDYQLTNSTKWKLEVIFTASLNDSYLSLCCDSHKRVYVEKNEMGEYQKIATYRSICY